MAAVRRKIVSSRTALLFAMLCCTASLSAVEPQPQTEWYRIEFDGTPVGYESVTTLAQPTARESARSAAAVRRVRETRLKLKRFGTDISLSAHLETVESADGMLERWSLRRTGADGKSVDRSGTWNPERSGFEIDARTEERRRDELIAVASQPRSPIIPAWIFTASGTTRTLWSTAVFFPESAGVADIEVDAAGPQSLQLADGRTVAMIRWNYWPIDSPEQKSSVWMDASGSVLRVEQPLLGKTLRFDRTDAATALGSESLEALDLQFRGILPVTKSPTSLDRKSSLTWTMKVGSGEQLQMPSSDFQVVESVSASELKVTVSRPELSATEQTDVLDPRKLPTVDRVYIDPSQWITSDDPTIRRTALFVAGSASAAWDKCQRLTRHVGKEMRYSPFSTALIPAGEVVKSHRGDCTEHAVLLTALLRAEGIPARVAIGFVYRPNPESFVPHMWTEARIGDRWVPLDSTMARDGVGVLHLKVADSALGDDIAAGTVLFIPLLELLGRAEVAAQP